MALTYVVCGIVLVGLLYSYFNDSEKGDSAESAEPIHDRALAYRSTYGTNANEFSSLRYSRVYQQPPFPRTPPSLPPPRVAEPLDDRAYRSTYGTRSNEFSSPGYSHVYQQPPIPRTPPLRVAEPVYDRSYRSTYGTQSNEFSSPGYSYVYQKPLITRIPPRISPPDLPRSQPTFSTPVRYSPPWMHSPPPSPSEFLSPSSWPDPQPDVISDGIHELLVEQSPGDRLRAKAKEERYQMRMAFKEAERARMRGDLALAEDLDEHGQKHQENAQRWDREASDEIFADKNKGRRANNIDLHGLFVAEAEERVEEHVILAKSQGYQTLRLIVGKGLHAQDGVSKMKPAIEELIQKMKLTVKHDPRNTGVLIVQLCNEQDDKPPDSSRRGRRKKKSQNGRRGSTLYQVGSRTKAMYDTVG